MRGQKGDLGDAGSNRKTMEPTLSRLETPMLLLLLSLEQLSEGETKGKSPTLIGTV